MASKLTKQINSRFNPTSLSGYSVYALGGYPKMYGFGSFLKNNWSAAISPAIGIGSLISGNSANEFSKQNAGTIGSVAGGALGTLVAPGIGTSIGAQIGGKLGSSIQNNGIESDTQMQEEAIKKQLISNLPAQHYYTPTFANGGELSYLPSITNFTTPINTDLTIEKNPVYNDRSRFRKMGPSFRVEANKLDSYIDNIAGQLNNYNFPKKEKDGMRYKQTEFRKLKEDLYNYQQNPDTKKFNAFTGSGALFFR